MAENPGKREESPNVRKNKGYCSWKWCWWSPPQEAVVAEFCNETSLHGLHYIGQPKRHISERIFWIIVFAIGVITAGFLVHAMIQRYYDTPVVVSFQSKEQPIDTIPFPAVTLCNINQFSKKKVIEMERIAGLPTHKHFKEATRNLSMIHTFCQSQKTFTQIHSNVYGHNKEDSNSVDESNSISMLDFLVENTIPCDQMIPHCMFDGAKIMCSQEFQTVITALGKCCTFNMMPLPLIFRNPANRGKKKNSILYNPALGSRLDWDESNLNEWSKWDYEKGFVLPRINVFDMKSHIFYPIRQLGPGKPYGFSMLIDSNTDDYYCPMSDAEGMLFTLHTSVEMPHVREFPSVLETNKEIYIKIDPDVTIADPDIRDLTTDMRQCYFGKEKKLKILRPYTRENCIDDCIADRVANRCNCSFFFMPKEKGVRVCNTDPESEDGNCVNKINHFLRTSVKHLLCGHCLALCEDIDYKYEITTAGLRNPPKIWSDRNPVTNVTKPEWADHKFSIVHIFFGTESTVPKLRKRLYGITDLIGNAGGILGLCFGFSVLSAIELLYFALVRSVWKHCYRPNCCGGRRTKTGKQNPGETITQNVEAPISP